MAAMARQMGKGILTARSLAESAAGEIAQSMENPSRLVELARSASLLSMTSAAILARLVILPADRPSVFRGPLSAIKKTVWSEPLALERIKQIGKASGATVNDVLVAVVAGGLRRYMVSEGDNPDAGDITVTVPVNLRPAHKAHELGNQFALVYLQLPLSESRPLERLRLTKKRMDVLKNSPEPMVVYQLLSAMGILPNELSTLARNFFSAKATAVLTNVPGPREQLYLAGKPLAQLIFWVPQSGDIGLGISIISYKGQVTIGLMVDEQLIAHPQRIVEQVEDEIALLEAELLPQ
jgi:WS/DGAT/MGAT family acyltransferase